MVGGMTDEEARRLVRLCREADRLRSSAPAPPPSPPSGTAEDHVPNTDPAAEEADRAATEAWARLYSHFHPRMLGFCRRVLPERAEDLAAEILLKARFRLDRFDASRPFAPWLFKIGANRCWDETRRVRRFEPLDDEGVEALVSGSPTPLDELITAERRERLGRALDRLPARQRFAITLRYGADLSYREIAETLGVTETNVGVLLLRGRRGLRRFLEDEPAEDEA